MQIFEKKSRKCWVLLIIVFIGVFVAIKGYGCKKMQLVNLMDYDIDIYDVLLNGAQGSAENSKRQDALRDCPPVLKVLRFGNDEDITEEVLSVIDHYMEQYYEHGYLLRDPLDTIPNSGGVYVTAMDAPLLGVCCKLAHERTGEEKYRKYLEDLIPYLVSDTSKNGFILKEDNDNWWPLEYAWKEVSKEDAWYVYNGSLFGMVGIELIKNSTGDERLCELSEKVLNAYKKHAEDFYYENMDWCWYSLNYIDGHPLINTNEKLFIEIRALRALYLLTEDPFYNEEYQNRMEAWKGIYPVYAVKDNGFLKLMFLRAGAPHPYHVDIYPTVIEIYDEQKKLLETIEVPSRTVEYAVINEKIPLESKSYKLYAKINGIKNTLISEGEFQLIDQNTLSEKQLEYNYTFWADCKTFDGKQLEIDRKKDELEKAIIECEPLESLNKDKETYFIVELDNDSPNEFAIQIVLTDTNGNSVSRYLQAVKPGVNNLIFSHLGFKHTQEGIENIAKIRIDFITNNMKTDKANIVINKILHCETTAQVVNYLSDKQFTDFWYYE